MKREKRKAKKGALAAAPIEEAVKAVQEERRLFGAPLVESIDRLFVEDREGQVGIRSRLGVKKELTIDRILRPTGLIPAFIRPRRALLKASAVKKGVAKRASTAAAVDAAAETLFDMWENQSATAAKKTTRIKVDTRSTPLYSYRPHLPSHIDKLVDMEAHIENSGGRERKVHRPAAAPDTTHPGLTMEEQADRELLDGVAEEKEGDGEEKDLSVAEDQKTPARRKATQKKTRTERNKQLRTKLTQVGQWQAAAKKKFLAQVNQVAFHTRVFHKEQAARAVLASILKAEGKAPAAVAQAIPLLPDEVPLTLRQLPATHVNPLHEQYERVRASGILESRARRRHAPSRPLVQSRGRRSTRQF